jgi:cytoskeletal protein CcmA (bactofilin family)
MSSTKDGGTKVTVVEDGTEFRGSMFSSCAVLVRGRIAGDVSSPSLAVTQTGFVSGRIKVATLTSDGELAGEIDADTVTLAGRVSDGTVIRAKTLEAKLSSEGGMTVTFGDARLEVGDDPTTRP